jgi:hypothetical protein
MSTCLNDPQSVRLTNLNQLRQDVRPCRRYQGNFFFDQGIPGMDNRSAARSMTLSEKETENEANRLIEQVEVALAAVALRSPDSDESLEASADRIERAARDLGDVLRQLAKERRADVEET